MAAVTFDADHGDSFDTNGVGASPLTIATFSVAAGTNVALFLHLGYEGTGDPSAVTYNGNSLTPEVQAVRGSNDSYIWYVALDSGGTTSGNLIVTHNLAAANTGVGWSIATFENVDQTDPVVQSVGNSEVTATGVSVSLLGVAAGSGLFSGLSLGNDSMSIVVPTGMTGLSNQSINDADPPAFSEASAYELVTSTGDVTRTWTHASVNRTVATIAEIRQTAAGGGGGVRKLASYGGLAGFGGLAGVGGGLAARGVTGVRHPRLYSWRYPRLQVHHPAVLYRGAHDRLRAHGGRLPGQLDYRDHGRHHHDVHERV